jgi:hypothetical protein
LAVAVAEVVLAGVMVRMVALVEVVDKQEPLVLEPLVKEIMVIPTI